MCPKSAMDRDVRTEKQPMIRDEKVCFRPYSLLVSCRLLSVIINIIMFLWVAGDCWWLLSVCCRLLSICGRLRALCCRFNVGCGQFTGGLLAVRCRFPVGLLSVCCRLLAAAVGGCRFPVGCCRYLSYMLSVAWCRLLLPDDVFFFLRLDLP